MLPAYIVSQSSWSCAPVAGTLGHPRSLCSEGCVEGCLQPGRDLGVLYLTVWPYPRNLRLTVALPESISWVESDSVSCVKDYSHWEDHTKQTSQTGARDWENIFRDFAASISVTWTPEQQILQQWVIWAIFPPSRSWNLVAMRIGVSCGECCCNWQSLCWRLRPGWAWVGVWVILTWFE